MEMGVAHMTVRMFRGLAFAAALLAAGCGSERSYEEAARVPPYSAIPSETDRRWLYDYHMTRGGALAWLEDEIAFLDRGLRVWHTSDGTTEFELAGTGKNLSMKRDAVIALVQEKGGAQAAAEIVAQTRTKVGGTPDVPGQRTLAPGLAPEHTRAQKLTYPELWKEEVKYVTDHQLKTARQVALLNGDKDGASRILVEVWTERRDALGDAHPHVVEVAALHMELVGTPLPGAPALAAAPAAAGAGADTAQIDSQIAAARATWQSGDRAGAYKQAQEALNLARRTLGENHPKTQEVAAIVARMTGGQ